MEEKDPKVQAERGELTGSERAVGWIYLPVHIFCLPFLLSAAALVSPAFFSLGVINAAYYAVGFVFVLLFFRRFLRRSFDALLDHRFRNIFTLIVTALMDVVLGYAALWLLSLLLPGSEQDPNTETIVSFVGKDFTLMRAMAIFIAPVVEEVLFRGVVFGSLRRKSRLAAYASSALLFGLYHVWQYALTDPTALIYILQYIPPAVALAWCYEESKGVWMPIFFHMLINAVSFSSM